nr:uncharacterized protein LOC107375029 [Nothobranchius furzeri]
MMSVEGFLRGKVEKPASQLEGCETKPPVMRQEAERQSQEIPADKFYEYEKLHSRPFVLPESEIPEDLLHLQYPCLQGCVLLNFWQYDTYHDTGETIRYITIYCNTFSQTLQAIFFTEFIVRMFNKLSKLIRNMFNMRYLTHDGGIYILNGGNKTRCTLLPTSGWRLNCTKRKENTQMFACKFFQRLDTRLLNINVIIAGKKS